MFHGKTLKTSLFPKVNNNRLFSFSVDSISTISTNASYHIPVMLEECCDYLNIKVK